MNFNFHIAGECRLLKFSYHMYGNSMGTLRVLMSINSGPFHGLFGLAGPQENEWKSAVITIPNALDVRVSSCAIKFQGPITFSKKMNNVNICN